ncbi:MAG: restriction endonuclease subunit S [Alteromonadaceae bacterium]|nr:restriction endonuclease subunit S [Alteromonadaceae bacterium]
MSELPKGWVKITLGEIANWTSGGTPSRANKSYYSGDIPWVKTGDLGSRYLNKVNEFITKDGLKNSSAKLCSKGSIGLAMYGATIGKVSIFNMDVATNQACAVATPKGGISSEFIYFMLSNEKEAFIAKGKGGAQPNISQTLIKSHEILLPPLNEQIRIANKLDALLAKVDAAQVRLDKIPTLLKRFRQAVLAAATSGELTKEWRENNILVDTTLDGFELPLTWSLLTFDDIGAVKGGKRLPKGEELLENNTGFPYIRAGQLKNGTVINLDTARNRQLFLKPHVQEQIKRYTVFEGDVYITIVGASIGDAGVIPSSSNGANLTENAAKICEFTKPIDSKFVSYWLRSELLQGMIKLEIKSGAQGKLALKRIKTLPIPYPPMEEQVEIVRRVESLFTLADSVEKQYNAIRKNTNRLTQSLLAKAFRGELVPQDPNDEPAEKLLAKIAAAREASLVSKSKAAKITKKLRSKL